MANPDDQHVPARAESPLACPLVPKPPSELRAQDSDSLVNSVDIGGQDNGTLPGFP